MKSKPLRWGLAGLSALFVLSSLAVTLVEYNRYHARPIVFAPGSQIAGVPVGGLDEAGAAARLSDFYSLPLVLTFNGATIHARPSDLGFAIDPNSLTAEAAQTIETGSFWRHLWNNNAAVPVTLPLSASVNEAQVLTYLNTEIIPRYTGPDSPILPIVWTTNYQASETGQQLLIEQVTADIKRALLSPTTHTVILQTADRVGETQPLWSMLEAFLRHNLNWTGFSELVEVYLESMATGEVLHFALQDRKLVEPNIAFPAASTSKIPIMISVLRRIPEPIPEQVVTLLNQMIARSENPPADTLMATYLDEVRGPLIVSEDLAALGIENSFLAGYFYLGAPLLQRFETPANTRQDIFLNPDEYNQTIPAEAGELLSAIYACAEDGDGLLIKTFPGEITPSKCRLMIEILAANRIGLLIEAGVSHQATVAHKHGWATDLDGQLRFMSDVGIVFTTGGDYVLNIFLHDRTRLDFDEGNRVIARLSQTVYNFFNIDDQVYWWFD